MEHLIDSLQREVIADPFNITTSNPYNKAMTPFRRKHVCRFNMGSLLSAQFTAVGYASANTSHSAMQKSGRRSLSYRCKAYRADTMDPWMTSIAASRSATEALNGTVKRAFVTPHQ